MKHIISLLFCLLIDLINLYGQELTVTSNLNLREGPGVEYPSYGVIRKNAIVHVMYEDGNWAYVKYNGNKGFVNKTYLRGKNVNEEVVLYRSKEHQHSSYKYNRPRYYTNSENIVVQSPTYYESRPNGATAVCRDGTYSFSRNRRGTCSRHGGVAKWL